MRGLSEAEERWWYYTLEPDPTSILEGDVLNNGTQTAVTFLRSRPVLGMKAWMAIGGMAWLAGPIFAQQPQVSTPTFEVASVRLSKGCRDGEEDSIRASPGGLTMHCQTVMVLIQRA